MIRLPLIKPDIDFSEVEKDFRSIFASGTLTRGRYVECFERAVAKYLGIEFAFATTSATTALHLSLIALGIGRGDEVLVSDFTFPASGNAIVQTGAVPVLVDCAPGRFDFDASDAVSKVSPKTKAIMAVSPFGQPCNSMELQDFSKAHDIPVIEDAACSLGAVRNGTKSGAWSELACFSFHPRKVITTGEGGMVVTNSARLAEKIQILRNHGANATSDGISFIESGFNYRLSELQAAMGLSQMHKIDAIIDDRRRSAKLYIKHLTDILPEITIPLCADIEECSFQSFVVMLPEACSQQKIITALRDRQIETTLGTYAMHSHPAFSRYGYHIGELKNSYLAQGRSLTLPIIPRMRQEDIHRVVSELKECLSVLNCHT